MRRKHRVIVEVTFDVPCTSKEAKCRVIRAMERATNGYMIGVTKVEYFQFSRYQNWIKGAIAKVSREQK